MTWIDLQKIKKKYIFIYLLYFWPCWVLIAAHWLSLVLVSEKVMASHSSTLAWKIPWTEEPGRLQSMGSLRVGHD